MKLTVPKVFTVTPLFAADIAAADPGDASKKPGADCIRLICAPTMVLLLMFPQLSPKPPKKIEKFAGEAVCVIVLFVNWADISEDAVLIRVNMRLVVLVMLLLSTTRLTPSQDPLLSSSITEPIFDPD